MRHHENIIGLWQALDGGAVAVDEQRCVVVRDRHARCRACAEACPTGCISLDARRFVIQPERCVGCGTCATACPAAAIAALEPDDETLFAQCREAWESRGVVTVSCAAVAASGDVPVRCLGRVDEGLLSSLEEIGVPEVTLRQGACERCPLSRGIETARQVVQTFNALAGAWGRAPFVSLIADDRSCFCPDGGAGEAKDEAPCEAALAEGNAAECSAPAAGSVVKVDGGGVLPRAVPQRRTALLRMLQRWGEPDGAGIPARLWGEVAIDADRCVSCRMCAVFCPTGALSRTEAESDLFGLLHTPSLCVHCETCQSVCLTGALKLKDAVSALDIVQETTHLIPLEPPAYQRVGPHSATDAMRNILGCQAIYEK